MDREHWLRIANNRRVIRMIERVTAESPYALDETDDARPKIEDEWVDGFYIRTMRLDAGVMVVSKLHKSSHPYFVKEGQALVLDQDGMHKVCAPFVGVTTPGTKRVIIATEDLVWSTVHKTDKTTVEEVEQDIIEAESMGDVEAAWIDVVELLESSELVITEEQTP